MVVKSADFVMMLMPDEHIAATYATEVEPHIRKGATLAFAHGFNIRYGTIQCPAGVDVTMIAPKAPGHRVREVFVEGGGTPGLVGAGGVGTAAASFFSPGMPYTTARAFFVR